MSTHPCRAGLQLMGNSQRTTTIFGEHAACEAIYSIIGGFDNLYGKENDRVRTLSAMVEQQSDLPLS